jgi:hypothetical protein
LQQSNQNRVESLNFAAKSLSPPSPEAPKKIVKSSKQLIFRPFSLSPKELFIRRRHSFGALNLMNKRVLGAFGSSGEIFG